MVTTALRLPSEVAAKLRCFERHKSDTAPFTDRSGRAAYRLGDGMADRPILFSAPMVRALLAGTKTQTRRVIKQQPPKECGINYMLGNESWLPVEQRTPVRRIFEAWGGGLYDRKPQEHMCGLFEIVPRIQPGDRLDPAMEIPGYPDYCVGISGIVYSRKGGEWSRLIPSPTSRGYPAITLCSAGNRRTTNAHTLTCEAFHGPRPSKAHQARHIDGDRKNGCAANLCWGTQSDNWRDRKAHGNGCEGEKHHAAKFTDAEREHLKWGYERGLYSQRHAARILGVRQSSIQQICATGRPDLVEQDAPDQSSMRLTLIVTDVRVQRLQEISEEDAVAEGVEHDTDGWQDYLMPATQCCVSARDSYRTLWDAINGPGSWEANPWVAAYTFTVHQQNIDSQEPAR